MPAKQAELFVDLSSNNRPPTRRQLKKHYRAGRRILFLKCSQGTGYVWDLSHRLAAIWHKLGGRVGHYHWTTPGGAAFGAQQAEFFWAHVKGDVRDGDIIAEDLEQNGATETEHAAFWTRLRQLIKASGLEVSEWTYSGAYFIRDNKIKPHGTQLWGAGYPDLPFKPAGWKLAAHQYTDKASAPGLAGTSDESQLLVALPVHKPRPRPKPAPKPRPAPAPRPGKPRRPWWFRWWRW